MTPSKTYESVAVSSRIRLARNFTDYPFPGRLLRDPHGEEQAREIVRLVSARVEGVESFVRYDMAKVSAERAEYLAERNLISRDLINNRRISAALVSRDESISVMINEEDHIREQYFIDGLDLTRAFERILGIDDVISYAIPFAYDQNLGYLTACPTNLGTGLRASVMLFLPALSRSGKMHDLMPELTSKGLTVRGAFGEGSGAEGELFQISNEVTLGPSEEDILAVVEESVCIIAETELRERERMRKEEGLSLEDRLMRSYGILLNCRKLGHKELMRLVADVKLGIALGFFVGVEEGTEPARMRELDSLVASIGPASVKLHNKSALTEEEQQVYRAEYASASVKGMLLRS